jgi:hypothetical protein
MKAIDKNKRKLIGFAFLLAIKAMKDIARFNEDS